MKSQVGRVVFWYLLTFLLGFLFGLEAFGFEIQDYHTPGDEVPTVIVEAISKARKTIKVQAYHLTDEAISKALVERQKHGVPVAIIMDRAGAASQYTTARLCKEGGCQVRVDREHQIAHNKIIIIDSGTQWATLITGSYNFTNGAFKRNAENLLVITEEPKLVNSYAEHWDEHWLHTVNYDPKPLKPQIVRKARR